MSYFAVYSKDRKIVVCMDKNPSYTGISSTYSWGQDVNKIDKSLKIRVLKTRKGQVPYLESSNKRVEEDMFEIVETDERGIPLA